MHFNVQGCKDLRANDSSSDLPLHPLNHPLDHLAPAAALLHIPGVHQQGAMLRKIGQLTHPPLVNMVLAQIAAHEGFAKLPPRVRRLIPQLQQRAADIGDIPVVVGLVEVDGSRG